MSVTLTSPLDCAWPSPGSDTGTAKPVPAHSDSFYGQVPRGMCHMWDRYRGL